VVKGQRPPRSRFRFGLMSALARWTRQPLLRPVPAPGGAMAQATEVRRLGALIDSGVRVPRVLHQAPDFLVLSHEDGVALSSLLTDTPPVAMSAFRQGLDALAEVHARGQYLSQAFARNMLLSPEGVVFLDFEDDPLEVMSLTDAQARDWLAYLLSTLWCVNASRGDLIQLWNDCQALIKVEVRQRIIDVSQRLAWMRHLPKKRDPWGRDLVSLQAMAVFLTEWLNRVDQR
jgi:tRNA A-37 threonylcarbamoyl transferase component Bud32